MAGNLTSGNLGPGIFVRAGSTNTVVADNLIGRNRTDAADLCNGGEEGSGQLQDQGTNTMSGGNTFGAYRAPSGCCAVSGIPELAACRSRSVAPLTPANRDDCQAWLDEQLGPGVATAQWFNPDYSCAELLDACPARTTPTTTVTDTPTPEPVATATSSPTITSVPMPTDTPTGGATATATSQPADTVTPIPCVGDCNRDGTVAVNELILGVNFALGLQSVDTCPAFANPEGAVDIAQLVAGGNNSLSGCEGE